MPPHGVDRPNILLLLTDQQSGSMLSCAGNDHVKTPAMDSIAARGTRFERAYCTNPVCAPSKFSLMTGRFPSAINLRSNDASHLAALPDSIVADGFGARLRDVGYEANFGGKFGVPTLAPNDIGLEHRTTDRREGLADHCVEYFRDGPNEPFFLAASFINPHDICFMAIRSFERDHPTWSGPDDPEAVLDAALAPPAGLTTEEFVTTYCPPLPANHEPQRDEPEAIQRLLQHRPFRQYVREDWSEAEWRRHRWAYCRLTERVDRHIGRVLATLEAEGLREETLIICTSDHGDHDGAHRLEHKTIPYEEAVRVPLLVEPPGPPGSPVVDHTHLVSNGLDLLPTICDYAGIDPPRMAPGRSVRPLLDGSSSTTWRDELVIEFEGGDAVVTDGDKYVRYDHGAHREQLYDLEADPGETRNAAGDREQAGRVVALRDRLAEHRSTQTS